MSTFVIGDIHGCYQTLQSLLERCGVKGSDHIWCVGDLINRGPDSLKVIEWAMRHEDQVQVILGNHELHYLACLYGATTSSNDTLDDLLSLSSRTQREIAQWLRRQPLLFEDSIGGRSIAMVHAGVNSEWTWREVRARARRAEHALQSDDGLTALAIAHPSRKRQKKSKSTRAISSASGVRAGLRHEEWIEDLKWFTRVRALDKANRPIGWFKGEPDVLPLELRPWFAPYSERVSSPSGTESWPDLLCYGHWAAFGIQDHPYTLGLDSGCIWGRHLSALKVEDKRLYQVEVVESPLTPKHLR